MSQPPEESTWDPSGAWQAGRIDPEADQALLNGELVWGVYRLAGSPTDEPEPGDSPIEEALIMESVPADELAEYGITQDQLSRLERFGGLGRTALETVGRYKILLLVGAMAVGIAADIVLDPGGLAGDLALPAVAWGVAELGWIGGAAVSVWAVGKRLPESTVKIGELLRNPLKVHELFGQLTDRAIAAAAKDNPAFWAGFWANTAFAVAEGIVPPILIFLNSPPEGWPKALIFLFDLAATWFVRQGIWDATHPSETEDNLST